MSENIQTNNNSAEDNANEIDLLEIFFLLLGKWHWFILSATIAVILALVYLATATPVYTRSASVLIKDNSNNPAPGDNAMFVDLGFFKSNINITNELLTFRSPSLMTEVVNRLNLHKDYTISERMKRLPLYGKNPVTVNFSGLNENQWLSCDIELLSEKRFRMKDIASSEEHIKTNTIDGILSDSISTPWGMLVVRPTMFYSDEYIERSIRFEQKRVYAAVTGFNTVLRAELGEKAKSTIINLSLEDVSTERAEDILGGLIAIYNENWIKDKNQIAISTSAFINDRLAIIESELSNVDSDISSFKSKNLMPDIQAVSNIFMTKSSENKSNIFALENQLSVTQYVRDYMDDPELAEQLLPANAGIDNLSIEKLIGEYNTLMLQRNSLLANSSERNPLVVDMNQSLQSIRQSIVSSLDNFINTLTKQVENFRQSDVQTSKQIASNPNQARYLLSVERQQKVKEALYLYLLQKREENELSQAFTAYNTKIIDPPGGDIRPAKPRKGMILLGALFMGFVIPTGIIFLKFTFDNKVQNRKDLAKLSLPFIGEIPLAGRKKRKLTGKKVTGSVVPATPVVQNDSRDIINEAFRVVRTNLNFMHPGGGDKKTIMLTSLNPGSGKTFTTINLAMSMALTGRKVLAIDLDLRKGSLSKYAQSPSEGTSGYLSELINDPAEIIIKEAGHPGLDIIPGGVIPPNPAELLLSPRLGELLTSMKNQYDYILLDCPPVDIVADASIISQYASLTIFVVRAGLMDRRDLPEVEKLYQDKRLINMALLLNGIEPGTGRYGYGYRKYGY